MARRSLTRLNSLDDEKVFYLVPLHCPRVYIFSPLEALRTFTGASTLPQGYIFSSLEALRTFSLSRLHSLDGEEVFLISFLPQDARGR